MCKLISQRTFVWCQRSPSDVDDLASSLCVGSQCRELGTSWRKPRATCRWVQEFLFLGPPFSPAAKAVWELWGDDASVSSFFSPAGSPQENQLRISLLQRSSPPPPSSSSSYSFSPPCTAEGTVLPVSSCLMHEAANVFGPHDPYILFLVFSFLLNGFSFR